MSGKLRLQSYLRDCGLGSRRAVEELIRNGRVRVNGSTATVGMSITEGDHVKVGTKLVRPLQKLHFLVNKPAGYICSASDPGGWPRAIDLIRPPRKGIFTVGRLDVATTGLIIVTNDGEFADALIHPSSGHTKEYLVLTKDHLDPGAIRRLERGIRLSGGPPARARVLEQKRRGKRTEIRLEVEEGRHHIVRDLMKASHIQVERLKRVRVGPFKLGYLKEGQFERIPAEDVERVLKRR